MQQPIRSVSGAEISDPETFGIIGAAVKVHSVLGKGFLEPVYQAALEVEFSARRLPFSREVDLPVFYGGVKLEVRYRVDFLCFDSVIVELKALERITAREEGQVIHYLSASRLQRGLLLNFGARSLQYKRFVGRSESAVPSVSSVDHC